jgi:two-component system, response regulator YesN
LRTRSPAVPARAFDGNERLSRLRRFVEEHLDEAIPAVRAAEIVGLERRYFSVYFRNKVGQYYHAWLENKRVDRAKVLLACSDLLISEISQEVGFFDLRTFERAFRRCAGCLPRDYRKAAFRG